jgi:hypothetical protein
LILPQDESHRTNCDSAFVPLDFHQAQPEREVISPISKLNGVKAIGAKQQLWPVKLHSSEDKST